MTPLYKGIYRRITRNSPWSKVPATGDKGPQRSEIFTNFQ